MGLALDVNEYDSVTSLNIQLKKFKEKLNDQKDSSKKRRRLIYYLKGFETRRDLAYRESRFLDKECSELMDLVQ